MADVITRLKIESGEYDSKIKRAAQGLQYMEQECRRVNGTLATLEKDQKQYVQSLGQMETVSRTARGSLNELTQAYTDLRVQYNRLTDAEKKGDFGKALSSSLEQLKTRIKDAKTELNGIQGELNGSKFGQFGGVIDTIGQKLGLTANATELLTSKTAMMYAGIGAGIAVVGEATKAWVSYNNELAKQDQITTVTTGLKGDDADRMTDKMRALSDTYKVDFREAINAANTLMTQFGKTGDEATQLIKDGMQGMIQGDGPKLLSMIQQYAPAFRDAGVSASQLVAVIQNSEGGIFTDQNMNAIVMGIKNIRLMTKQTSDALEKLGIDGQEMSRKLNEGSITVFDALKQVASQLKTVDSNSQAAGEVMQAVFGRQGVTAGTNIAKAIETLNTNLEETKKQTGEVGNAFAELQTANEKLNKAIRDCFEYDGWEQMATGIKAKLVTALADVLDKLGEIKKYFNDSAPDWLKGEGPKKDPYADMGKSYKYISNGSNKAERQQRYDSQMADFQGRLQRLDKQERNLGKPYQYTDKNGGLVEEIDDAPTVERKRRTIAAQRSAIQRRMNLLETKHDELIADPVKPKKTGGNGGGNTTTTKAGNTPDDVVAKAEKAYAETMNMAQRDLMEGVITSQKYDETIYNGQKKLAEAYNKAYEETGNEKYLKAYQETSEHVSEMQGVVDANIAAQKAAEQSARELEQAQKRLADAQNELADAQATGDLKKIYAAEKKVETAQVQVDARTSTPTGGGTQSGLVDVPINISNLEAVKQKLTEEMATTPVGDSMLQNMQEAFSDASAIGTIFSTAVKNGIDTAVFDTSGIMEKLLKFEDVNDETIQGLVQTYNDALVKAFGEDGAAKLKVVFDVDDKQIKNLSKTTTEEAQNTQKAWGLAAQSVNNMGSALNAIDDPAAKAAGTVIKAIADIALGFAQASHAADVASSGWGWLAWLAAGTAAMATTISTVHSLTGFSEGGIVGGNSYSGDNVGPVMLDAGEVVLNRAQQGVIADALENEGGGAISSNPYVTGEMIYLGLNNYLKGAGLGQIVTSNG